MAEGQPNAASPLRSQADIKEGCLQCGALAVWTDSPQGPDYWYLPCGHSKEMLGAVVVTRTVVSAAQNPDESPFDGPSYETVEKGFDWIDRRVYRHELPDTPTEDRA